MTIEVIQYSLAAVVSVLLGYQVMLSLLAFRGKKIQDFVTSRNRKFAIILPAEDEEKSTSRSLYSLSGLVYPKNLYDLIVVVDNYTDKSAAIADKLGAIVLECSQQGGKNNALRWAFDQILQWDESYDAIIVFDTDSLVSGNYLEVMNYYLENGSEVIQSSDLVLPQPDVWSNEASRIRLLLYNYVKPLGRKVLGLGMGLRCNGLCFSTDVLRQTPWQSQPPINDVEYGLVLQLEGIDIDYAPEAEIWTQVRDRYPNSVPNRKKGASRYSVIRKYTPQLLAAFVKKRSLKYLDIIVDLITPPLVNILLFILLMCTGNALLWSMGWAAPVFFWMWLGLGGLGAIYLLAGLAAAGADWQLFKSISYLPRYVFWRLRGKSFSINSSREKQVENTLEDSEALAVDDSQVQ